jgi:hypothetical protein
VLASVSFQSAVAFGTTAIEAQQDAANAESVANPEQDPSAETAADDVRTLQFVSAGSIAESDTFDTDLSNSDLLEAKDRAWQYRPYRVAVWICLDGSPELSVVSDRLKEELLAQAELIDPSG